MDPFQLTEDAIVDIDAIWLFLLEKDGVGAADRIVTELFKSFYKLAEIPNVGHRRNDLTSWHVLFYKGFLLPCHLCTRKPTPSNSGGPTRKAERCPHPAAALVSSANWLARQAMAQLHSARASNIALIAALTPFLFLGAQLAERAEPDPHRPTCDSAECEKIKSFLKAHYCAESPAGNGPDDSCEIADPKKTPRPGIEVIAHFDCAWSEPASKNVCRQYGQPSAEVRAALTRELRRLGLPAAEDRRTYFSVWRLESSGWSVAEGYYERVSGSSLALCQVLVMLDPNSRAFVVRELPFQKTDADVPLVTTWSILDLADVDGDGRPDVILRGDAYENHWIEVHTVRHGASHMIFSGLGYYL